MQRILCVLLLTLSPTLSACNKCMCKYLLDIVIANTTKFDCFLSSQSIMSGQVYSKNIPLRVASGEQSAPYTIESDLYTKFTNITMNLQCGDDKFISLQTQREYTSGFWNHTEKVTGIVTAAANLDASYGTKLSACDEPKPARIYWTIQ